MSNKECTKCKETKSLNDFYIRSDNGRIDSHCKECYKKAQKNNYSNNKQRINNDRKIYYKKNEQYILNQKKEYHLKNKIEKNEKSRLYRLHNLEELKIKQRKYHYKNREIRLEGMRKYIENNPEKFAEMIIKRRYCFQQASPSWAEKDKIKLVYLKAKELKKVTGFNYHVDHVIPLQGENVCGLHVWMNLQVLESGINIGKGNRYNE